MVMSREDAAARSTDQGESYGFAEALEDALAGDEHQKSAAFSPLAEGICERRQAKMLHITILMRS